MKKEVKTKRASPKKPRVLNKKKGRKPLVVAVGELCFWVHDGPVVRDLRELHDAFWCMTPEQFAHHVRSDKNDFAVWTMQILADPETARKIESARTPEEAGEIVNEALQEYSW